MIFLQPGFYLALTGLGAGGGRPSSEDTAATVNWILYVVFSLSCVLGSSLMNVIGPRATMSLSALGYALYTSMSLRVFSAGESANIEEVDCGFSTQEAYLGWHTSAVLPGVYARQCCGHRLALSRTPTPKRNRRHVM